MKFLLIFCFVVLLVGAEVQTRRNEEVQTKQQTLKVKGKEFDFWKAVFKEIPQPEKPPQPIIFSHKIHVEFKIDCKFCHYTVEKSIYATIPPVSVCVGCHNFLPQVREKPEVQKIYEYWERGEPIPWRRVHDLPDHVNFPHMIHIKKGVLCEDCHGQVASMDTAVRVSPLTMGWCLNCHRQKNASTECWICHK